jgi:propanol-preferring alcohol dehydrogenase
VGRVVGAGRDAKRFTEDDRVGIAWLRSTCGVCRYCRRGDENLCESPSFTGWDADGGYAEYAVVDERYAYRIPQVFSDRDAAPLLCAGIIGYRSLRRSGLRPGGRLGIYGFGGSAHLTAQVALHEGATVHVMTRAADARQLALELGCASAQGADDPPPEPLDAAILFAPVGSLVLPAMKALDPGGRLAIAGIHLSDIPPLDYDTYLFQERELVSVTANTRRDGEEFLALAAEIPICPTTTEYPFDQADSALVDLAGDAVNGAAVIRVTGDA